MWRERVRGGEGMQTMARLLIGFALLIVVASVVIVAGTVYSGGGPQGQERQLQAVPPTEGSKTSTRHPWWCFW